MNRIAQTIISLSAFTIICASEAAINVHVDPMESDTGWTFDSNWTDPSRWLATPVAGLSATSGSFVLHHNSQAPGFYGTATHSFTLTSSNTFDFSMDVGNFDNFPFSDPTIEILQGASVLGTLSGETPSSGGWETWTSSIVLSAGEYSVRVTTPVVAPESNTAVDNFVVAIPEAGHFGLLSAVFAAAYTFSRSRKRQNQTR